MLFGGRVLNCISQTLGCCVSCWPTLPPTQLITIVWREKKRNISLHHYRWLNQNWNKVGECKWSAISQFFNSVNLKSTGSPCQVLKASCRSNSKQLRNPPIDSTLLTWKASISWWHLAFLRVSRLYLWSPTLFGSAMQFRSTDQEAFTGLTEYVVSPYHYYSYNTVRSRFYTHTHITMTFEGFLCLNAAI